MNLGRVSVVAASVLLCSLTVGLAPASGASFPKSSFTDFTTGHPLSVKTSNGRQLKLQIEASSEKFFSGPSDDSLGVDLSRPRPEEDHNWTFDLGGKDFTYDQTLGTGVLDSSKDLGGFGSVALSIAAKGKPSETKCGKAVLTRQRVTVAGTIRFNTHSGSHGWGKLAETSGTGQFAQPGVVLQLSGNPNLSCLAEVLGGGGGSSGGLAELSGSGFATGCPYHALEAGRFDGNSPLIEVEQRTHGHDPTKLLMIRGVSQQANTEDVFRFDISIRDVPKPIVKATPTGVRVLLRGDRRDGVTGSAVLTGTGKPRKIHVGCDGKKVVGHVWNHASYTNGAHRFTLVNQAFGNISKRNSKRKGKIGFLGSYLPPKPTKG